MPKPKGKKQAPKQSDEAKYLTLEETAVALNCTTQTVWRWWKKGALKAYKLRNPETGRLRRKMFKRSDVEKVKRIGELKKPEMIRYLLEFDNFIRGLGYARREGKWVKKYKKQEPQSSETEPTKKRKGGKKR